MLFRSGEAKSNPKRRNAKGISIKLVFFELNKKPNVFSAGRFSSKSDTGRNQGKEEGTQEIKRELLNTLSKEMQSTRRHKVLRTETKRDRS